MSRAYSNALLATQWNPATELVNAQPWLPGRLDYLRELAARERNWDGYGSSSVSASAQEIATLLLVAAATADDAFQPPAVCPVSGGGIQLEWRAADRELEIEILPDGLIAYLAVVRNAMTEGTFSDPSSVLQLLRWLRG